MQEDKKGIYMLFFVGFVGCMCGRVAAVVVCRMGNVEHSRRKNSMGCVSR
jgi:hypothetical protein